jgi:hypothetical protein
MQSRRNNSKLEIENCFYVPPTNNKPTSNERKEAISIRVKKYLLENQIINLNLQSMKATFYKKIMMISVLLLGITVSLNVQGQKQDNSLQKEQLSAGTNSLQKAELFKPEWEPAIKAHSNKVRGGVILDFDTPKVTGLLKQNPKEFSLVLPTGKGNKSLTLKLRRSNIFAAGFKVFTSGNPGIPFNYIGGLHYQGVVEGDEKSLVAISVFDNEVMGLVVTSEGNYNLGSLKNESQKHIFYLESDLVEKPIFQCDTKPDLKGYTDEELSGSGKSPKAAGDCVGIYIEGDQSLFAGLGTVEAVTNLLTGLFNQSAILFDNEDITVAISEILIWNTVDPYDGTNTSQQLAKFQANTGAFNGDLGTLVALQNIGGLAAGFSGLCNSDTDQSLCFSGLSGTGFNNVPTYSFNVFIFTHELGHLFGSRHTHACVWNGNNTAIDGCSGYTEIGSCPIPDPALPAGGGTIMSYCNSTSVGVNFSLGFGDQPGNVIRNEVINAACLSSGCPCDLPVALCKNITVNLNNSGNASISPSDVDNGSTWACGFGSWSVSPSSFTCADVGVKSVTLTVTDANGDVSTCSSSVTIVDNIAPSAVCQDVTISLDASGQATVSAAQVNNGSSDACGIQTMTVFPNTFSCADVGDHLVTLTVTDVNGLSSTCTATVTVEPKATNSLISVSPDPQQYSDKVTFTATIEGGASCAPDWLAAESVTFYLGAIEMGSANFEISGADLVATLSDICLLEGVAGLMSPGTKTVTATFAGLDQVHYDVSQPDPISFEITPEDAVLVYNGQEYFSTPAATNCTGIVTLMTYVGDTDDTPSGCRGDIRNARITFSNGGIPGTTLGNPDLLVGLVNPGNFQEGIAITDFTHTLTGSNCSSGGETFEVWIRAGNYYTGQTGASDVTLVTLATPGSEFVTGGGHFVLSSSAGSYAGTSGSKMNFGFNMKWNPSGKNLQGNINIIFRKMVSGVWRTYQIKSNKINSMAVNQSDPNYRKAIISTKANLRDITDPANPISLGGNLNLAMDAWEHTSQNNGELDKIAVTLTGSGSQGLFFSSHWVGTGTVAQIINGGKIKVRSSGPGNKVSESPITQESETDVISQVQIQPNPFQYQTDIRFEIFEMQNVTLRISDSKGKLISVLHDGMLDAGQHRFTFDGIHLPVGMYFYTLVAGGEIKTGKIVLAR